MYYIIERLLNVYKFSEDAFRNNEINIIQQ